MGKLSKDKGSLFEREAVNQAKEIGLQAERAWGSNGKTMGQHEEVDLMLEGYKVQCKRRKKLGEVVRPNENVDLQLVREDRGKSFVIIEYSLFLNLLKKMRGDFEIHN